MSVQKLAPRWSARISWCKYRNYFSNNNVIYNKISLQKRIFSFFYDFRALSASFFLQGRVKVIGGVALLLLRLRRQWTLRQRALCHHLSCGDACWSRQVARLFARLFLFSFHHSIGCIACSALLVAKLAANHAQRSAFHHACHTEQSNGYAS